MRLKFEKCALRDEICTLDILSFDRSEIKLIGSNLDFIMDGARKKEEGKTGTIAEDIPFLQNGNEEDDDRSQEKVPQRANDHPPKLAKGNHNTDKTTKTAEKTNQDG